MAISVSVTERKGYKNLYLEVYDKDRRIKRVSAKTCDREVAEKKRAALLETYARLVAGVNVGQAWDQHVAFRVSTKGRAGFSEATEANYNSARKRLLWTALRGEEALLDRDLGSVDGVVLSQFHDHLAAHYSGSVVKSTFNCLKMVWDWAHTRMRSVPPYPGHPKINIEETDKEAFTLEEMRSVLEWTRSYLNGRWFPYFMLLGMTGARSSEILGLRGRDLDRSACTVRIPRRRKGNKTKRYKVFAVDPRVVAVTPDRQPEDLLFPKIRPAYRDGLPTDSRVTLKVLRKAILAVGIPAPRAAVLDQHSFRRSWTVLADSVGVSLGVAMDQQGHRSAQIHLDYRKRTVKPEMHDAVRMVTDLFGTLWQGGREGGALPPTQVASPLKSSEIPREFQGLASC